jgi:predicted ATP-grasp superfamily ATP-dependent carboligase
MAENKPKNEPVLVLGGGTNTLSILRSLSQRGIVVAVSTDENSPAIKSRYCQTKYVFSKGADPKAYWADLLLSDKRNELKGSVLFACCDDAIQFICAHRDELARFYRFYDFDPKLHLALLEKQSTLELARSVGVGVPQFWTINRIEDIERILPELTFPVIVKPLLSHEFRRQFGGQKYLRADNADQLLRQQKEVLNKGLRSMVCDFIPGPDSLTCFYISYRNAEGQLLFEITESGLRRYPKNKGVLCYTYTEWKPGVAEQGRKLLQGVGFTGLSSIEFKLDPRDNQYKLIEINPRFDAGVEIFQQSGIEVPYFIYCHTTDRPLPEIAEFQNNARMINVIDDFRAYLELKRLGELTLWQWLKSMSPRQNCMYFKLYDPWPAVHNIFSRLKNAMIT